MDDQRNTNGAGSLGSTTNSHVPDGGTSARVLNRPNNSWAGEGGPSAVRMYRSMAVAASPTPQGPGSITTGTADNFAAAKRTADYVQKVMDIGPTNRLSKTFWGFAARQMCVHEMYARVDQDLAQWKAIYQKTGGTTGYKDQLESQADWAKFYGCGNCGEYSSIAFTYLRDKEKVHPLDWIDYNDFKHAFVIVGRVSGSLPEKVNDIVDAACIKDWGDAAVLCDAYYGTAVAMPKLISHFEGKQLHLLHRIE